MVYNLYFELFWETSVYRKLSVVADLWPMDTGLAVKQIVVRILISRLANYLEYKKILQYLGEFWRQGEFSHHISQNLPRTL